MFFCVPRRSVQRQHRPNVFCGIRIVAVMIGSRISSTLDKSGSFDGFDFEERTVAQQHLVMTVGAVVIKSIPYSRSSRS
jgi:hypothetical protein